MTKRIGLDAAALETSEIAVTFDCPWCLIATLELLKDEPVIESAAVRSAGGCLEVVARRPPVEERNPARTFMTRRVARSARTQA